MRMSDAGKLLIIKYEGFYARAYLCPARVPTIGYGHTSAAGLPKVYLQMAPITQEQAMEILENDLRKVEREIERLVNVQLRQEQFDVLVSFQFNTGKLAQSTLLRLLNKGRFDDVPRELLRWVHADGKRLMGLVNRRMAEAAMWNKTNATPVDGKEMVRRVDAPKKAKPATQSTTILSGLTGAASGAVIAAKGAADMVKDQVDSVAAIASSLNAPIILVIAGLLVVGAGIWVVKERNRLLNDGAF